MELNKLDLSHLFYQRDKAVFEPLLAMDTPLMLTAIEAQLPDHNSPLFKVTDTEAILHFKRTLIALLDKQRAILKQHVVQGIQVDTAYIQRLVHILKELLNWDVYLIEESLNCLKYLDILVYSPSHSLIADVFEILGKTSFDPSKTLFYYYVLSYLQHWNNHNDRNWTIVDLIHIQPSFLFEFSLESRIVSIKRSANMSKEYQGLNFYQVTMKILEEEKLNLTLQDSITHELLCKVRLAMCPTIQESRDKLEYIRSVLASLKILSFIDLVWYRKNPHTIPNIFTLPPTYVMIFKQTLDLFLHPECDLKNRLLILDMLKVIINYQVRRGESNILVSLLENYNLLQNFLIDMKCFVQNKETRYVPRSNFENTEFILRLLKLFDNLETGLVFDSTPQILEGLFYNDKSESKVIEESGTLIIDFFLGENNENQIREHLMSEIEKGQSRHIHIHIAMLTKLLSEDVRQRTTQRRDSAALAREISERPNIFRLVSLIQFPLEPNSVGINTIKLITSICGENPLLTNKLTPFIELFLKHLVKIENYPRETEGLECIVEFLHCICLKEGEVRELVVSSGVINEFMKIFHTKAFSGAIVSKYTNSLISAIYRFITNIYVVRMPFLNSLLVSFEHVTMASSIFETYMDNMLGGIESAETVRYEEIMARILVLFKLFKRVTSIKDLAIPHDMRMQLENKRTELVKFKYLNIHNLSENKDVMKTFTLDIKHAHMEIKNAHIQVPLHFLDREFLTHSSLEHIFGASFFNLVDRSNTNPAYKDYLDNFAKSSQMERILQGLSVGQSFPAEEVFTLCLPLMKLLPALDRIRAKEDIFNLSLKLSKIKKTFATQKEKVDLLRFHIKLLGEKNGPFSLLHQRLRRLLTFSRHTCNFDILQSFTKVVVEDLSDLNTCPLSTDLEFLYLLKLKIQNLQYLLNTSGQNVNQRNFPIQFTQFVIYYTSSPYAVIAPLIRVATFYYRQPCQDEMSQTWILRLEIFSRIINVLNSLLTVHEDGSHSESESQNNIAERCEAINFVMLELQRGLVKSADLLPREPVETKADLAAGMSEIIEAVVRAIHMMDNMISNDSGYGVEPRVNFRMHPDKKISSRVLKLEVKELFHIFKAKCTENLEQFAVSSMPYINMMIESASNLGLKPYQRKRCIREFYNSVSSKLLSVSKQLFDDFVLDLGIRHPKESFKDSDPRKCVLDTEVLVESLKQILLLLSELNEFGKGELQITPHYLSEVLRLVTSIVVNWRDIRSVESGHIDPFDMIIVKGITFIEFAEDYLLKGLKFKEDQRLKEDKDKDKSKTRLLDKNDKTTKKDMNNIHHKKKNRDTLRDPREMRHQEDSGNTPSAVGTQVKGSRRKNKSKKLWEFNSQISLFVETVINESAKTSLMGSETFQHLLEFIFKKLSKRDFFVEQAKLNFKNFNLFAVQLKDTGKSSFLSLLTKIICELLPTSHHRVDTEAIVKRVFFEFSPKKVTRIPFALISDLEKKRGNIDQFVKVIKKICIITKNEEESSPVSYLEASAAPLGHMIALKSSVSFQSISIKLKKPTHRSYKKSACKEDMNTNETKSLKYLDYVPDGQAAEVIRQLLDFTIESIIKEAVSAKDNTLMAQRSTFVINSYVGIYALHCVARFWPTLIPMIVKHRCRRVFTSPEVVEEARQLQQLIGEGIKLEDSDMTFIGFVVRVATPLLFNRLFPFLWEICADNYVLVQASKECVVSLGSYVRTKVLNLLSVLNIDDNIIRSISHLSLLESLLKLREFTSLAIKEGTVEVLHKEVGNLDKMNMEREAHLKTMSFLTQPLTLLHVFNLNYQISKQKPIEIRAQITSLASQWIPSNYFKKNKFSLGWPYNNPDEESGNLREFDDDPPQHLEDPENTSFMTNSEENSSSDSHSGESDDMSLDDEIFFNNEIGEMGGEDDRVSRGWTSNMGDENMDFDDFSEDSHGLDEIPEMEELDMEMQDEDMDQLDIDDFDSEEIIDEMYRNDDDIAYSRHEEDSDISVFIRDTHKIITHLGETESLGTELLNMHNRLMHSVNSILRNDNNPIALTLDPNSLSYRLLKVAKRVEAFLQQNNTHLTVLKDIHHNKCPFSHRKWLHDDSQTFHTHRRRHGEILQFDNQIIIRLNNLNPHLAISDRLEANILAPRDNHAEQFEIQIEEDQQQGDNQEHQEESREEEEIEGINNREVILNLEELLLGRNSMDQQELVYPNLNDERIRELLRQNQFDEDYFYSLDPEGREEVIQNMLGMLDMEFQHMEEEEKQEESNDNDNQPQLIGEAVDNEVQEDLPNAPGRGRRKISMEYNKRIEKDPKEIILREKKENRIYVAEDSFLVALLNLLYFDVYDFKNFPYPMLRALCTNPTNESHILSCLLIILKHPNLKIEKIEHGESPTVFPKTVLQQRNKEIISDYEREGYKQVCEKALYILFQLSKSNASGMLQSSHNKVGFLPSWYYVEEIPFYTHLIHLIKTPAFRNNELLGALTDVLYNIVNHHSMKYIHAMSQGESTQFQMRLPKEDIQLLCSLLEGEYSETKSDEVVKNIVLLLCVNECNLRTFISTFEGVIDTLSKKSMLLLKNEINEEYTNEDKLHNILRIVASMFEDQFLSKIENNLDIEKNKTKVDVLKEFKRVLECPSLVDLFKQCAEEVSRYPQKILHLDRVEVIMLSFFIVYNIVTIEEEEHLKANMISKMEELNIVKKSSINGPLLGLEIQKALGEVFNYMKNHAKPMVNYLLKEVLKNIKKSIRSKEVSSIFHEPLVHILSKHPVLIDYDNKRAMFRAEIKNMRRKKHFEQVDINVNRDNVLLGSMNQVMAMSVEQLHGKFHVVFEGEEGEDAGGLTREWYTLLSKEIFNPHYALFEPSSTGNTYQPSPKSYINPNHLQFFKFIGRVVGKALHDGYLLDAYFTPAFYKHILGKTLSWKDMEEEDYEFYKNLQWLLDNDVTDLDLTFCYEHEYFGNIELKDLIPNGSKIPVTEDNKAEYVQRRCYTRMATTVEKQIQSFLTGFHQLIPHQTVAFFEPKELELMISGLPTIDIQDLKDNTDLVNYEKNDNVITWLFEVLEGFDNSLRAAFLQFVTGTSKVPSEGFKSLRGVSGPHKFNIQKDFMVDNLPRAHTCFNQLDLPNYPTKDILVEKLTLAITEGRERFGFL